MTSALRKTVQTTVRSTFDVNLTRYGRSKGVWFLLLAGLIGARFWVPRDDGTAVVIAINKHLPLMTSAMLGTSIGVVITTLLLPLGFIYLRSNTARRQPWQIEEVTVASRAGIALGRFFADVAVFAGLLGTLTVAAWVMAWLTLAAAQVHLWQIAVALWLIGAPTLMASRPAAPAAPRGPWTRRALGDFAFFVCWIALLTVPMFLDGRRPGFRTNMFDVGGFVEPLMHFASGRDLQIGFGGDLLPGRISIDVMQVLLSPEYIAARLAWAAIAVLIAALAGSIYRPHTASQKVRRDSRSSRLLNRLLNEGPAPQPGLDAVMAKYNGHPALGIIAAELRLMCRGHLFLLLSVLAAISGAFVDYRHVTSPAIFLLLIFGFTAQAGRQEARGLLALTATTVVSPWQRRASFCLAGLVWALVLSIPALALHGSLRIASLAVAIGLGAAVFTMLVSLASHSAFAARLLLLLTWYAYVSVN